MARSGAVTYELKQKMTVLTCFDCHIYFGVPEDVYDGAQTDGDSFQCPNGHEVSFAKTTATEAEGLLAKEKVSTEFLRAQLKVAMDELKILRGLKNNGQLLQLPKTADPQPPKRNRGRPRKNSQPKEG